MNSDRPSELLSVAHYHQRPGTQPAAHAIRPDVELVELVTGGRGWIQHEGEWIEALPGSLFWHIEGDRTIERSDPEEPYSCLAVRMRRPGSSSRCVPRVSYWHDLDEVSKLTEEAIRLFLDEDFAEEPLLDYLYSKLRLQALLYHFRRERADIAAPLRLARSIIEKRYAEPIKVSDLARAAGWSVAHLHDRFQAAYGATPRQVILERRLSSAREQLLSSGQSIKEIAAKTGFTHSSAFCSAFRRRYGSTPKSYRDSYYYGVGLERG